MSNFASNEKVSMSIFNLAGQIVYTNSFKVDGHGFMNVDVSAGNILSPGNYYLVVKGNLNFIRVKLVICK